MSKLIRLLMSKSGIYFFIIAGILQKGPCYSQITLNAPVSQDTYATNSGSNFSAPTINTGGLPTNPSIGYLEFDLSSIPYGSYIASASLQFNVLSVPPGPTVFRTFEFQYIPLSWNQSTVTPTTPWSNDNTISDMPSSISVVGAVAAFNINVTSHVDYMVGRKLPYGWKLVKNSPIGIIDVASSDNSTASLRPKLTVQYYLPVDVSIVTTPASTGISTDGVADITPSGGSGNFSYQWYNAAGSPLVSTQDLVNAQAGLYKLEVKDNTTSKTERFFVVIGNMQGSVTVSMQPDEVFSSDANVRDALLFSLGPLAPEPFRNYPTDNFLRSGMSSSANYLSFLKFNYLGLEEANNVVIETATLSLYGNSHSNQGKGTSYKLRRVTQQWFEDCVTMVNQPATTIVQEKNINPGPTGTNPDEFTDITDFVTLHSQNPILNYGYSINWYATGSGVTGPNNYDNFHSSNSVTAIKRPILLIRFSISKRFFELQKKIDGATYNTKRFLNFHYTEEYNDANSQLAYNIYEVDNNKLVATQVNQALPVKYGDNRYQLNLNTIISGGLPVGIYLLEVINEKKEKSYLRFNTN